MGHSKIDRDDTVVLFADLQAGIADLPLTVPMASLKKSVLALARLAKLFGLPAVVSAVPGPDGAPAAMFPEIEQGTGAYTPLYRSSADSFENDAIRSAIEATGRKTVLISGVATEVAVQLPALSFADHGYRVFIVIDAVAGISARSEEAALSRIRQAGGSTVSVASLSLELGGDFGDPVGQHAMGMLFETVAGE